MRIEIAGAQITDAVVEVLDDLQNDVEMTKIFLETIDEMTRATIVDIADVDSDAGIVLNRLRSLQKIRRIIATLATPPDVDDPANDVATASF